MVGMHKGAFWEGFDVQTWTHVIAFCANPPTIVTLTVRDGADTHMTCSIDMMIHRRPGP